MLPPPPSLACNRCREFDQRRPPKALCDVCPKSDPIGLCGSIAIALRCSLFRAIGRQWVGVRCGEIKHSAGPNRHLFGGGRLEVVFPVDVCQSTILTHSGQCIIHLFDCGVGDPFTTNQVHLYFFKSQNCLDAGNIFLLDQCVTHGLTGCPVIDAARDEFIDI